MEKCPSCNGKITIEYLDFKFRRFLIAHTLKNIKHMVCQDCGEEYISPDTMHMIEVQIANNQTIKSLF